VLYNAALIFHFCAPLIDFVIDSVYMNQRSAGGSSLHSKGVKRYWAAKMAAENYHLKWDSHLSYLNTSIATLYK